MDEEFGLDPLTDEDWEEQRKIAHKAVDDMLRYLRAVRSQPVWKKPSETLETLSEQPAPQQGQGLQAVYDDIKEQVLPHRLGNIHPRFWGWVIGTGTFSGALADFIASIMNPNNGGGYHAGIVIERQVINWAKQMMGYPEDASGLLVTGGSMANLTGLAVARNSKAGYDIRKRGIKGNLIVYGSTETHSSIQKSVELLGMGTENYRKIPVKEDFTIDCQLLELTIKEDLEKGNTPICIVGTVGTVNTAAVDDIPTLRKIADKYGLWLHVDGAFGAVARLSPKYSHLTRDIEKADSIAFDFHKWLYINYEIGCILVRNKEDHYNSFALTPEYLAHATRGVHGTDLWFTDYGVELSRNFKALKAWTMIRELGLDRFSHAITQNIEQCRYLETLVNEHPQLELMAPVSMNIVCFRFNREGADLDRINEEILFKLHEEGIAVPSYTRLNGNYVIRVANTNHRTRKEDFDLLVQKVVEFGNQLA